MSQGTKNFHVRIPEYCCRCARHLGGRTSAATRKNPWTVNLAGSTVWFGIGAPVKVRAALKIPTFVCNKCLTTLKTAPLINWMVAITIVLVGIFLIIFSGLFNGNYIVPVISWVFVYFLYFNRMIRSAVNAVLGANLIRINHLKLSRSYSFTNKKYDKIFKSENQGLLEK